MNIPLPPIRHDPYDRLVIRKLQNGAEHWHLPVPGLGWFSAEMIFCAGSRYDPAGRHGLAHLVEHLMSQNAALPYEEMRRWFESVGSWNAGACGFGHARYGFDCYAQPELARRSFELMASMFRSPITSSLEHELEVIRSEISGKDRAAFIRDLTARRRAALFGSHPIAQVEHLVLGSPEALTETTYAEAAAFRAALYGGDRLTVITVGDGDSGMLDGLVDEFFGTMVTVPDPGVVRPFDGEPPMFGREVNHREEVSADEAVGSSVGLSASRVEATFLTEISLCSSIALGLARRAAAEDLRDQRGLVYSVELENRRVAGSHAWRAIEAITSKPGALGDIEFGMRRAIAAVRDDRAAFEDCVRRRRKNIRFFDLNIDGLVGYLRQDVEFSGAPESLRQLDAEIAALTFDEFQDWCCRFLNSEQAVWWVLKP